MFQIVRQALTILGQGFKDNGHAVVEVWGVEMYVLEVRCMCQLISFNFEVFNVINFIDFEIIDNIPLL